MIYRCQGQLNWNSNIITNTGGRRAGAAAKAVYCNNIGTAAGNTAGNCCNVVYRCNLNNNWLLVLRCLFKRKNKLTQIFNRINIVVRGGRNGCFWRKLTENLPHEGESPIAYHGKMCYDNASVMKEAREWN